MYGVIDTINRCFFLCFVVMMTFYCDSLHLGYPLHRENSPKKSLSGKTQGIWKFCQNTGNLVFSSCKFPDYKGKRYFYICRENSTFSFLKLDTLPRQFGVCNSHKSRKLAQGKFAIR